ncbi:dioxygenase [Alkalihalobacillus sp. AL-G]|uniref:dioxygenase family protein n=1 Tax=Alkalihalobacillus sp. AL-G TaxID=2926399 RepID=UPI00272BE1B1|nr:class III extradiol ring-cleavage dioxygenase [Alkalihalobacillus sp. AL-G]WLD94678.1 dioxygenase [Alkalihalobacillus sp. AL-G]
MMPSFFVAHGAPLLAIEDNDYTQFLNNLGCAVPRPKAIVLFSAHWESSVQKVSKVDGYYKTIYDFGGFPEELYRIQYAAKGDQRITTDIQELFTKHGVPHELETERGLDHGAWVVLKLLYPNADIPVISMSVNPQLTPEEQYKVGESLSALQANDILIIGSGGTVHNLSALNMVEDNGAIDQWARDFDEWLARHLKKWDVDSLFNYKSLAPAANRAVPPYGNEHFIPIFYAMGAADDRRDARLLHRSYRYGNLSQSVWQFG